MCSGCVTPFVREVSKNVHNSSDDHTCKLLNCEVMMMPPEFRGEISWMTCRWSRSRRLSCNRNIVSSVGTVFQAVWYFISSSNFISNKRIPNIIMSKCCGGCFIINNWWLISRSIINLDQSHGQILDLDLELFCTISSPLTLRNALASWKTNDGL